MINYFTFNEKSSLDFNTFISGENTWNTPSKDIEVMAIPGRNGTLSISNNRYKNVNIAYKAFIADHFEQNFGALKAYLMTQEGYGILEDSYHPDHYRRARYVGEISPEMTQLNRHGEFELTFDCDPRRFLKSASKLKEWANNTSYLNNTLFRALPLIRAYGTGSLTVGNISVTITSANVYTDLDSELQEAYKGATNCNANITLTDGKFPVIEPGNNLISYTGLSKIEIRPNLWTI